MIKYCTTLLLLLSLTSIISAQIISENKDANNYYGIFGGSQLSGLPGTTFERYVNIGSNSIEVTQSNLIFSSKPEFIINGSGGNVIMGGELNRNITSGADLLPFAYGTVTGSGGAQIGSGNYSMDFSNPNFVTVTFNDTNVNARLCAIQITPRDGDIGNNFYVGDAAQARIRFDTAPTLNSFNVILTQSDGQLASHRFFSFIAHKL